MNERIEKMMLDATKDMPPGYYVPGVYFEMFANLIIKECIKVMMENDYHGEWLGEKVKQHFEVT